MADPEENVICRLGDDGIEVFAFGKRYFSMPWPWIDQVRVSMSQKSEEDFEIPETLYGEWPVIEKPQAEHGLRGYSAF